MKFLILISSLQGMWINMWDRSW